MSSDDNITLDLNKISSPSASSSASQLESENTFEDDELIRELENDDSAAMRHIREARLNELKMKAMQNHFAQQNSSAAGSYVELAEKDFLKFTTSNKKCLVHFFHADFGRCAIMHKHLEILAKKYQPVHFAKINVEKAKFFVNKLNIQVLPAVLLFEEGILKNRIIGFDQLGSSDNFPTKALEAKLRQLGFLPKSDDAEDDDQEEEEDDTSHNKKTSTIYSGGSRKSRSYNNNDDDYESD